MLFDWTSWITMIGIHNFASILEIFNIFGPWQAGELGTYHLSSIVLTIYLVVAVAIYPWNTKKYQLSSLFSMVILLPPPHWSPRKKVARENREQKFSCINTKAPFTTHKRVFLHNLDNGEWVTSAYSHQSISHIISAKALQKPKIQASRLSIAS